jgi:molybdopterin-dependent oxidoreductase alpha subunit
MRKLKSGGGWPAIWYTVKKARQSGGILRMLRALSSRNACKTCALGMGGQRGGMVNEAGRFPEVCKKSVQAMAADMQGRIREGFFSEFGFDRLQRFTPRELEASGRLVEPLLARPGDRTYRAIPWDEALALVVGSMRSTPPPESFFYFSGRSSNEASFLLQLFARLYGTNNVNNCSFFCHQASGVALKSVTGSGTATVVLDDVEHADLLFLIGANPASNHPRLMRNLVELKRRGGSVVVINPLRELGLVNFKVPSDPRSLLFGSDIADDYIQPHIGGDIALLSGIAKTIHDLGAVDQTFITDHTEGYESLRQSLDALSWEEIEQLSGVPRDQIDHIARRYAASKKSIFCWTMGMTHHEHGVQNVQAIANLALLRGMLGKPGAGLLPLRGHSNVQGVGSMCAVPILAKDILRAMQERLGVELPKEPGLDTLACLERAAEGKFRFTWCLGGNLYGSAPDSSAAARSMAAIDTVVYLSTTLNTGHIHGRGRTTLILPVQARDEEAQPTTQESMFNYVRLSDGGKPRHDGPRSEVQVICRIARDLLGRSCPLDFEALEHHENIRQAIAAVIPGYEPVGAIDKTRQEFQIPGRTFHQAHFATDSGRARFHAIRPPALKGTAPRALRLMTIRSEGQFNTVVYEDQDIYRGQERRDVILMNQGDIAALGLAVNDRVTVRSSAGEMPEILVREIDIRAGNAAMYYPEANILVPAHTDPASRTPAFKSIAITVTPSSRLAVLNT